MSREIEEMCDIIRRWDENIPPSFNEHSLLCRVYGDIPSNIPHMINSVIKNRVMKDLQSIEDTLALLSEYEKRGMVFNFINYKTQENK